MLCAIFMIKVINVINMVHVRAIFILVNSIILLNCVLNMSANGENNKNNVCKHFLDYSTILVNPNCSYNPDVGATTVSFKITRGFLKVFASKLIYFRKK